ncbi:hypothetical protein ABW21_db0207035 [Orbilia brochopaga]|nr:hypothetical protein ABW21_db0207035 [Drechslerella brochopaga]
MEHERYTDEKHPEGVVYHVEVAEPAPKPKRPLWRRIVRTLLTVGAIFMVWSTLAPVFTYRCHRNKHDLNKNPPSEFSQSMDDVDTNIAFIQDDSPTVPPEYYSFSPDLKSFWLRQESILTIPTKTQVVGKVIVHACPKAANISAYVSFVLSDPSLRNGIIVDPRDDGIIFKLNPFSVKDQTVNATIVLVVPKSDSYSLDYFSAHTIQLPIYLKETFTTAVNTTRLASVSGNIFSFGKAADNTALNVNNVQITSVSGSINGEYPLYHALDLASTYGTITASVVSANLKEQTGFIKTNSVSGNTNINFLGKLNPRPLISKHTSVTGDINVTYPSDWQGGLQLTTTSGKITVHGKGTKVVQKKHKGSFWRIIKGNGKSKGTFSSVSGKINVLVGQN